MALILIFFVLAYAAMQALFYVAACAAYPLSRLTRVFLLLFLIVMLIAPLAVRPLDHSGHAALAYTVALPGYLWMAGLFWFCPLWLLGMLGTVVARHWPGRPPADGRRARHTRRVFQGAGALVTLAMLWGWQEANHVRVEQILVPTPQLPPGTRPLRLVLITDLHLDVHRGQRFVERVAARIRDLHPDVILSAGDMADSIRAVEWTSSLARLEAPLGKYAVLGNHDYYLGFSRALAWHQAAGFRLLRQKAVRVAPGLIIAGVDHRAGRYTHQPCRDDAPALLSALPSDSFILLLQHEPTLAAGLPLDLQLSGHTHGGQLFPFNLLERKLFPWLSGLHRVDARAWLYVSRGVGTWGPPLRLGIPPEITLLTLVPATVPSPPRGLETAA